MIGNNFKEKALVLRSRGYTFREIERKLNTSIPKGTLSYWCKNVALPKFYKEKINKLNKENLTKGRGIAHKNRQTEQNEYHEELLTKNKHLLKILNKDTKKLILAMLYLGEGAKWKGHRGLMLGSSDPLIIQLYIKLLEQVYDIKKEFMRARISYRADQNIVKLTYFWSKITGLPKKHFYKTIPDPRSIGKITKNSSYKGVCVITCAGTKIQLELESIAELISRGL